MAAGPVLILQAVLLLLACQLTGEALARWTALPLPGPVTGLVILLIWFALTKREHSGLTTVSLWLSTNLALLFVPAAVGVIDEGGVLAQYGFALLIATVASTVLSLAVSAAVFRWALARFSVAEEA